MKSIDNYQEQLAIISRKNDFFELDNDLQQYGITEEYYNKIVLSIGLLKDFIDGYLTDIEVVKEVRELTKSDCPQLMKICVAVDIMRCYEGLNHPTSFTTPEGIALLVTLVKVHGIGRINSYHELSCVDYQTISLANLTPYIDACSHELGDVNELLISKVLQTRDSKLDNLYRVLIYKLCQTIAEVDGKLSSEENEWLEMIARIDDDIISNDIDVLNL